MTSNPPLLSMLPTPWHIWSLNLQHHNQPPFLRVRAHFRWQEHAYPTRPTKETCILGRPGQIRESAHARGRQ